MADEPTLGEVTRRLDHVVTQLAQVVESLKEQQRYMDANFVRQAVWLEARRADQGMASNLFQDIGALQEDRKGDAAFRRQAALALAVLAISTVVSIALAVVSL